jgi:hypothetical protein
VTENTVQLNTHSSTAEKSTVRLKEDLISNDIKEEPFDYEFIETQEVKHRKIVTENTVQLDTHSSTGEKSTVIFLLYLSVCLVVQYFLSHYYYDLLLENL